MTWSQPKSIASAALALALTTAIAPAAQAETKKYKVFLSMSFTGSTWQEQSKNMLLALAKSKDYKDKVDVEVQVSGPDPQKQIQQMNAMVEAGANIIIAYPISPTALNRTVRRACDQGVVVMAYDSTIDEPCAHNVHVNNIDQATTQAEWLVKAMNGKGNVLMIDGVSGTSANDLRVKAMKAVFDKTPGVKVLAEEDGQWTMPGARNAITKSLAIHKWQDFGGVIAQTGCYVVGQMQDEAGIPDDKKIPCAGSAANGERLQMLPADTKVEGANGSYRPMGFTGFSFEVPNTVAAIALKNAVDELDGKTKLPHDIWVPLTNRTNADFKLCKTGSWEEMHAGCNVFSPSLVPDPAWNASVYSPDLPQLGVNAALSATPEK
jgi:ribose transport system substrate-binding protein